MFRLLYSLDTNQAKVKNVIKQLLSINIPTAIIPNIAPSRPVITIIENATPLNTKIYSII